MDQKKYRQAKETGGLVSDADLQSDEIVEQEETVEAIENEDAEPFEEVTSEEDNEPELSPKEKTAFDKRLDRERTKLEEKLRKEIEEQSEQKYSKHRAAIEAIGGDPDKIIAAARENVLKMEADRLGEQNYWSDEDKQLYINQRKQEIELKELRVQRQIDKLKTDPDYAGIESMEKDILTKIDKSGGQLTVDEAYWALGGAKKAAQIKLDAQMREIEKRKQTSRTVLTDTSTTHTQEKPLPDDVMRDAKRMGISAAEARKLMNAESPKDIDDYRRMKAK